MPSSCKGVASCFSNEMWLALLALGPRALVPSPLGPLGYSGRARRLPPVRAARLSGRALCSPLLFGPAALWRLGMVGCAGRPSWALVPLPPLGHLGPLGVLGGFPRSGRLAFGPGFGFSPLSPCRSFAAGLGRLNWPSFSLAPWLGVFASALPCPAASAAPLPASFAGGRWPRWAWHFCPGCVCGLGRPPLFRHSGPLGPRFLSRNQVLDFWLHKECPQLLRLDARSNQLLPRSQVQCPRDHGSRLCGHVQRESA